MTVADSRERPRQLVVISGKGGTGKTSVVAALASLARNKVLADCDVDAPDLHLVLSPERLSREPFVSGKEARIDPGSCSGCGECALYCRFGAIAAIDRVDDDGRQVGTVYRVDHLACEGCGLCARVCPSGAVEMFEVQRGEVFVSDTRNGPLVHALLAAGGENSGKLVTRVRERALDAAEQAGAKLVILDGPPGIGCPVIASVTGADLALLVTEPSVSGLHDLERVAALVKGFGIPLAVCINKSDINPALASRVRETCQAQGIPVVSELSYDLDVARAQTEGKSIFEYGGSRVAGQIAAMWDEIEDMLKALEA